LQIAACPVISRGHKRKNLGLSPHLTAIAWGLLQSHGDCVRRAAGIHDGQADEARAIGMEE
jgi:hypothetical protein